jgi:hypothetical protein
VASANWQPRNPSDDAVSDTETLEGENSAEFQMGEVFEEPVGVGEAKERDFTQTCSYSFSLPSSGTKDTWAPSLPLAAAQPE